jgi:DNA invertase Pin-like site-specific DNA recombinase
MQIGAAYIRVSTDDQLEYSPDSQLKAIREYAKNHNIILPDDLIFVDEGISGRTAEKRPAFMRMIALAKAKPKQFDVILLWKFSRFARNREDSIVYKSMLRKQCGIEVVSISEQLGEDKTSILIEALLEAMDEYYSINLAEEVRRGMTEKASRGGVVSAPPFGYDAKNGIFVPNPDTAPVVKQIFNDFLGGKGCREIAMQLNSLGLRTKNGNLWENRTVEYVLRNVTYIGKIIWTPQKRKTRDYDNPDTIITDGEHEPIIDRETFEAVQNKIMDIKAKHRKYEHPVHVNDFMLRGLVRCSACGSTLAQSVKGKYLQCHRYSKGQCTVSHSISIDRINNAVIERLEEDIKTGQFEIIKPKTKTDNTEMTNSLLKKEYQKLERVKQAYEDGIDTLDEYKDNKAKILKRIKELEENLQSKAKTSDKSNFAEKVFNVLEKIKSPDVVEGEKNTLLKTVVSDIIFNRAKNTVQIVYHD